eukprot:1134657_1
METSMTLTYSCVYILIILTSFLASHIQGSYDYNNWIKPSSPTLPRRVDHAAVGYASGNEIWIVGGGVGNWTQPISYILIPIFSLIMEQLHFLTLYGDSVPFLHRLTIFYI